MMLKRKGKKSKTNSFEERNLKIAKMADKLKEKHGHGARCLYNRKSEFGENS